MIKYSGLAEKSNEMLFKLEFFLVNSGTHCLLKSTFYLQGMGTYFGIQKV